MEKKKVWKIEIDGSSYIEPDLYMIGQVISNMFEGEYYKLTCLEMTVEEIESLPEFEGF